MAAEIGILGDDAESKSGGEGEDRAIRMVSEIELGRAERVAHDILGCVGEHQEAAGRDRRDAVESQVRADESIEGKLIIRCAGGEGCQIEVEEEDKEEQILEEHDLSDCLKKLIIDQLIQGQG